MAITGEVGGVRFATGSDTDDGDYTTTLVAAATGKKIRVVGLVVTVLTTAGVFTLKSGSTAIFNAHLALGAPLGVNGGGPICETASGEALVASNGTGVDSYVNVAYQLVEA